MAGKCTKKAAAKTAEKKVNMGFIGYGIQARTILIPHFIQQDAVVVKAVCDCDRVRREAGAQFVNDYYKENKKSIKSQKSARTEANCAPSWKGGGRGGWKELEVSQSPPNLPFSLRQSSGQERGGYAVGLNPPEHKSLKSQNP